MVRKQEEFCRDAFDAWLREGAIEPKWEKVSQAAEPPDYFVDIRGERIAVEITSLFFPAGLRKGAALTQPAISAMLSASFHKLEERLIQKGALNGMYIVHIEGPWDLYSAYEGRLHDAIEQIVKETRDEELIVPGRVAEQGGFRLIFMKRGLEECAVGWGTVGPSGGKDLAEAFRTLVADRVAEKAQKLSSISVPKILLLLDETYICWPDEYLHLLKNPPSSSRDLEHVPEGRE